MRNRADQTKAFVGAAISQNTLGNVVNHGYRPIYCVGRARCGLSERPAPKYATDFSPTFSHVSEFLRRPSASGRVEVVPFGYVKVSAIWVRLPCCCLSSFPSTMNAKRLGPFSSSSLGLYRM